MGLASNIVRRAARQSAMLGLAGFLGLAGLAFLTAAAFLALAAAEGALFAATVIGLAYCGGALALAGVALSGSQSHASAGGDDPYAAVLTGFMRGFENGKAAARRTD